MADLVFDADFSQLSKGIDELKRLGRLSQDTAKGFEQSYRLIVQWQEKFAAQQGRVNAELEKSVLKQNLANKSARESAAAFEAEAKRVEQLTLKYKPLYAASMQYEAVLADLEEAHRRNILTTDQHAAAVDSLNEEYTQFVNGTAGWENQFVRGGSRAGKSLNKFGMYAQQVGYQVGDFFVQVQSGTNAFVAFGQQATQLAGLLPGVAGAVAGIGISVGTMLLAMWSRSKEAESGINNLAESLKNAQADSAKFADEIERLNRGLADTAELAFDNAVQQEKLKLQQLKDQLGEGDALSGSVEGSLLAAQEARVAAAEKELQLYRDRRNEAGFLKSQEEQRGQMQEAYLVAQQNLYDEVEAALSDLYDLDKRLAEEKAARDKADAIARGDMATAEVLAIQELYAGVAESLAEVSRQQEEAFAAFLTKVEAAKDNTEALAKIDIASGVNAAAIEASNLSDYMKQTLLDALGLVGLAKDAMSLDPFGGEGNKFYSVSRTVFTKWEDDKKGGKKGSKGSDRIEADLKRVQDFLKTERELLVAAFDERQNTLEMALQKGYLTKSKYAELELELEKKKSSELAKIDAQTQQAKVSAVLGGISQVLTAAANGNEKTLRMARIAGAAEALINTYIGASEALKLPFPANLAAAASIISTGFGFVNAIKSGNKSAGASGAAATMPAATQAAAPQRVIVEGLDRNALYSGEQLSKIFDALYKENKDRGFVFEVAR